MKKTGQIPTNVIFKLLPVIGLILLLSGCTKTHRYTSLDIDLMPCERGLDQPKFFQAIEFTENGEYKYPEQIEAIQKRLASTNDEVHDLVVFNHGWNKSPESAELDYQRFICRLHSELGTQVTDRKRRNQLMIIGVFWPSTITNRPNDPYLLKPVSYFKIRQRADLIAEKSLSGLFKTIGASIRGRDGFRSSNADPNISLVGHSFGARMTIRALEALQDQPQAENQNELINFLVTAQQLNVLLLNAAMPKERFDWIGKAVGEAMKIQTQTGRRIASRFTGSTNSYLFNLHSIHDSANRILFPLASMFNDDGVGCAVGACGIPSYETLCVSSSGEPTAKTAAREPDRQSDSEMLVWNASMQNLVYSHSDIYKGRVARLVGRLLYDTELREKIRSSTELPMVDLCR